MGTNAFINVLNNPSFDRHFGGTTSTIVADPYISGYHFIHWAKLPDELGDYVEGGDGATASAELTDQESIGTFLAGACLSVTPPGGTLNKTEFTGMGGIKWAVPTNIDYTNAVSVKFLEFSALPVLAIISGWIRLIRDSKTGVSNLNVDDNAYTKSAYAGSMLYWTTKPDGHTVEYSAAYTGMFPAKDPQEMYSGDLTAVDKLEVEIEFNVDWIWHEKWVHDACQSQADIIHDARQSDRGTNRGLDKGTRVDSNID